jgi:6-phosphogluconolactonase (cycloisomerase 2 family)
LAKLDPRTGALAAIRTIAGPSPSWICFNPKGDRAYAVNEIGDFGGQKQGSVTAYAVDPASGDLRQLNAVGSGGTGPVFAQVHPSGRHLLVANYGSGQIAVLAIQPDGSLGAATDVVAPQGTLGPTRAAAAAPGSFAVSGHTGSHAHMIATDPSGRFVLSTDLGYDRVYLWTLDTNTGKLAPTEHPSFPTTTAGAGARHFAFHPNGRILYVVYEEASQIASHQFDPKTGAVTPLHTLSTLPAGFAGSSFASSVSVSRDGRFLYCGNRLHNSVSAFATDGNGALRMIGNEWTRGDYPNQVTLDPSGAFLLASNRRSDQVTVFHVDHTTGLPRFTGQYFPVGSPNMVGFPPA